MGLAAVWLEEKQPDQALVELEGLDQKTQQAPRAGYLRAAAMAQRGQQALEIHGFDSAFQEWQEAKKIHQKLQKHHHGPAFQQSLNRLLTELTGMVAGGALREARGLKARQKIKVAIFMLQKALQITDDREVIDLLADLYCDRGLEFLKNERYSDAQQEFNNALKVKPDCHRAKEGASTTYNNEGVDAMDKGHLDQGIQLLETALRQNPDSQVAKRNIARAYHEKSSKKMEEFASAYPVTAQVAIVVEAKELLKKAHEYDPDNQRIIDDHNYLAEMLRKYYAR
jgi:tetratricopeptide (TPR) repeat protein